MNVPIWNNRMVRSLAEIRSAGVLGGSQCSLDFSGGG